jgi:hypothetical protein
MKNSIFIFITSLILILSISGCKKQNEDRTNYVEITHISLVTAETTIYQYHPIKMNVGLKLKNTDTSISSKDMTVMVGLVSQVDPTKTCNLVTQKVVLTTDGNESLTPLTGIPSEECLDANETSRKVNIVVSVHDTDDLLNINSADDITSVYFTSININNDTNQECTDSNGLTGCVIDLFLNQSPGIDVVLNSFSPASSVGILWSQDDADHHDKNATLSTDVSNIENFGVTTEIGVIGAPKGVINALEGYGEISIEYSIRPEGTSENWKSITIRDPNNNTAIGHNPNVKISDLTTPGTTLFEHDLFIEGDAYTAMDTNGIWEYYNNFQLRTCVIADFNESSIGNEPSNNCATDTVIIGNPRNSNSSLSQNAAPAGRSSRNYGTATKYRWALNYHHNKHYGSSKHMGIHMKRHALIGAGIDTSDANSIKSSSALASLLFYIGLEGWVDFEVLYLNDTMQANLSDSSLFYKKELKVLGYKYYSKEHTYSLPEVYKSNPLDLQKSSKLCSKYRYELVVAHAEIDICAVATAALKENNIFTFTDAFSGSTPPDHLTNASVWGNITLEARPSIEADITVKAEVDIGVLDAKVKAKLTLINVALDSKNRKHDIDKKEYVTGEIDVGLVGTSTKFTANADVDLTLKSLHGSAYFTGHYYSPFRHSLGHHTILKFHGYEKTYSIFHGSLNPVTIEE